MQSLSDFISTVPNQAGQDEQALVDLFNARPEAWQPVPSKSVLAWLGEDARTLRLEAFVNATSAAFASDPASVPADVLKLASAVKTTFLAAANPSAELLMPPGGPHHTLLLGLVAAGVFTDTDVESLVGRARVGTPAVVADVAPARAVIAKAAKVEQWRTAKTEADAKASALIDADPLGVTVDAVAAAYAAELAARMGAGE